MFHSHLDEVESTLKGQTYAWRVAAEQKGLEYAFTTYEPVQISDHDDNDDEPEMTYSDISHALSDQAPAAAKAALQMLSEKSPNRLDMGITMVGICAPTPADPSLDNNV